MSIRSQGFIWLTISLLGLQSVKLVLGCDKTQTLPQGCFCQGTDALECLHLKEFPPSGSIPPGIKSVLFHTCDFPAIGGTIELTPFYKDVTGIAITDSKIKQIEDDAFRNMMGLKRMDLSGNVISNISSRVFTFLPQLETLILDRNRLSVLPNDLFSNLQNLRKISLGENSIESLPNNFLESNPALDHVSLYMNQFRKIPDALQKTPNITNLNMAGNLLGDLVNGMFQEFRGLSTLDLASCNITDIQDNAFTGLNALQFLSLDNNKVKLIKREVFSPIFHSIQRIWLNSNQLTTLDEGILPFSALKEVKLGHNLWHCDQNIAWFNAVHLEKIDHENVTCNSPPSLKGVSVLNATRDILEEEKSRSMLAASIAIPIIGVCILIIFVIVYKIVQGRRQQKRASFRYSAVYRDTVETAYTGKHGPV